MKILITGAGGLVGRQLVPALAETHQVFALSRRAAETPAPNNVEWIHADLTSPTLAAQLPAAVDVVIHLAQSPRYAEFPEGAADVFAVNVASTARLLDWARSSGVRQFILASSGAVVLPGDDSFYAVSKRSAEQLVACYAQMFGVLALRFFFIYGAGQRRSMLVPRLVETIDAKQEVRLTGVDGPRINPVHVDDVAAALSCAVERKVTGTINVAGPDVLTIRQMSETIGRLVGSAPRFKPEGNDQAPDLSGDISAMREQLVAPTRRFDAGVTDVIAVLRKRTE